MSRLYQYENIIEDPILHSEKIGNEFLQKYLEEHKNDIYNITIEGKNYQIKVKFLINYIIVDQQYYDNIYYRYSPPNDIPKEYFRYAILSYFRENFGDLDINFGEIIEERLDEISRDGKIRLINQYYQTNNPNLSKIKINDELKEAIFKDMPNYYGIKLLEAIYLYIKLCKLLTYDDEFFAVDQKGGSAEFHEDIDHISEITPQNNKVVCYEFASIYEAMLKEFGIPSEIIKPNNDINTYGKDHTAVKFKIDGYLITADSTTSILAGDLFAAKLNLTLNGFECINGYNIKNFYKCIDMVYNDIHKNESNIIPKPKNIDELLEEYKMYAENMHDVSLKERVEILINQTNSVNLVGVDCLAYLLYLKKKLFQDEMKNNINISLIKDNTSDKTTTRAILQIKCKDEENKEYIEYYSYLPNQRLKPISIEELQIMFNNNELGYIKDDERNTISGIKVR